MSRPECRLLMASYYFPPVHSIGALRNYYIYRECRKRMGAVRVLTTTNREILGREPMPVEESDVISCSTFDYRRLFNMLSSRKKAHFSETSKPGFLRWAMRLNHSFPFNLLMGEGGLVYILAAYLKGSRIIREEGVTHLWSSYMPYADHMIAYLLKRRFPQLHWTADFRDLHVDPVRRHVLWPEFQRWCNRQILSKADLVTTVSEGLALRLRELHPNVHVLHNGIDPDLLQAGEAESAPAETFTITYTGSVYRNRQDPGILLATLSDLIQNNRIDRSKIRLVYAGKDGEMWLAWMKAYGLEDLLNDCGLISRQEALALQRRSCLNLLLSWSAPEISGVLTGKLYEYLAAGRPILALLNGPPDEEFDLLFARWKAGLVVSDSPQSHAALSDFIMKLYREWSWTGRVESPICRDQLDAFKWDNIVEGWFLLMG